MFRGHVEFAFLDEGAPNDSPPLETAFSELDPPPRKDELTNQLEERPKKPLIGSNLRLKGLSKEICRLDVSH